MRKIIFIPSRYNSSRFPGKPLVNINGKAVIEWVYSQAVSAVGVDDVYVATDSIKIRDFCSKKSIKCIFDADSNPVTGTDRVYFAAKMIGVKNDDLVINIQGDQPFFNTDLVNALLSAYESYSGDFDMATLCCRITHMSSALDPNNVKVLTNFNSEALYFSRSLIPFSRDKASLDQIPVYKHLGFYAYKFDFLSKFNNFDHGLLEQVEYLEQLRALENGCKIKVVEVEHDVVSVDSPSDIGLLS